MKKFIAMFAVLAASAVAQAQTLGDHPNARNDRAPVAMASGHTDTAGFHQVQHRRPVRHHRPHRRHHRRV